MTKVGFLASGTGSVMSRVILRFTADPRIEFCGVATDQPNAGALAVAQQAGIPTAVVPRDVGEDPSNYSERLLPLLDNWCPDWILTTFNHLLAEPVLSGWSDRIINVHYSLLPAFPGFQPIRKALSFGARFAGATVHLIDASVDMGPPILQAITPISAGDTEPDVQHRLFLLAQSMACQAIDWAAAGRLEVETTADRKRVVVRDAEYGTVPINPRPDLSEELRT